MKCKKCSKIIPDGFTDCPWCGATTGGLGSSVAGASTPLGLPVSGTHNLVIGISIVSSGVLFGLLSYFATTRSTGPLSLENSGYFFGRCVGAILLAAIAGAIFWKMRGQKPRRPVQVLVILTLSSLFTLLTLALPARPRIKGIDEATVRRYSEGMKAPKSPSTVPTIQTKWDPAARSLMSDIAARNQQYVSEISGLDQTAKPLYTPESFRDAPTVRQMIEQLRMRQAVADKYSDWRPIFFKMKAYVAAVNADEGEKRKFMESYEATLPRTLAVCKVISDKEHAWLQASLDLYEFALSKEGSYAWQNDSLVFKKRADSNTFSQKFFKARTLNTEFLKAYWEVRQAQEAMMAQLGLQSAQADSPGTR
jgi:hypothetical protein